MNFANVSDFVLYMTSETLDQELGMDFLPKVEPVPAPAEFLNAHKIAHRPLLHVVGSTEIGHYPVYFAIPSTQDKGGMKPGVVDNIVDSIADVGITADLDYPVYYTPCQDLSGWLAIKREHMPPRTRLVCNNGTFDVFTDRAKPGWSNPFDVSDPARFMQELLLTMTHDEKQLNILYSMGIMDPPPAPLDVVGEQGSNALIAIMCRTDACVEFDQDNEEWRLVKGTASEPSRLNNFSQHSEFACMAKEGVIQLSSHDLCEWVCSLNGAYRMLTDIYEAHAGDFLMATKYQLTHPMDYVDFFLRHVASTRHGDPVKHDGLTNSFFPVWLKKDGKTFVCHSGCTTLREVDVPPNLTSVGSLWGYEVLCDDTSDMYMPAQIAWLFKVILDRFRPVASKGEMMLYGAQQFLTGNGLDEKFNKNLVHDLLVDGSTRIVDLTVDQAKSAQDVYAYIGLPSMTASGLCFDVGAASLLEVDMSGLKMDTAEGVITVMLSQKVNAFDGIPSLARNLPNIVRQLDTYVKPDEEQVPCVDGSVVSYMYGQYHADQVLQEHFDQNQVPLYLVSSDGKGYAWCGINWYEAAEYPTPPETALELWGYKLVMTGISVPMGAQTLHAFIVQTLANFCPFVDYQKLFQLLYAYDTTGPWFKTNPNNMQESPRRIAVRVGEQPLCIFSLTTQRWEVSDQPVALYRGFPTYSTDKMEVIVAHDEPVEGEVLASMLSSSLSVLLNTFAAAAPTNCHTTKEHHMGYSYPRPLRGVQPVSTPIFYYVMKRGIAGYDTSANGWVYCDDVDMNVLHRCTSKFYTLGTVELTPEFVYNFLMNYLSQFYNFSDHLQALIYLSANDGQVDPLWSYSAEAYEKKGTDPHLRITLPQGGGACYDWANKTWSLDPSIMAGQIYDKCHGLLLSCDAGGVILSVQSFQDLLNGLSVGVRTLQNWVLQNGDAAAQAIGRGSVDMVLNLTSNSVYPRPRFVSNYAPEDVLPIVVAGCSLTTKGFAERTIAPDVRVPSNAVDWYSAEEFLRYLRYTITAFARYEPNDPAARFTYAYLAMKGEV